MATQGTGFGGTDGLTRERLYGQMPTTGLADIFSTSAPAPASETETANVSRGIVNAQRSGARASGFQGGQIDPETKNLRDGKDTDAAFGEKVTPVAAAPAAAPRRRTTPKLAAVAPVAPVAPVVPQAPAVAPTPAPVAAPIAAPAPAAPAAPVAPAPTPAPVPVSNSFVTQAAPPPAAPAGPTQADMERAAAAAATAASQTAFAQFVAQQKAAQQAKMYRETTPGPWQSAMNGGRFGSTK